MAKRFIDTGLFDDDWFMNLSKDAKILWIYFLTKCDHAGMLKLNARLCEVQTGIKDLNGTIKLLGNRIITVSERLYFIPKFLQYQYPGFPYSKAKAQLSAIEILTKHGLFIDGKLTVAELLTNSYSNGNGNGNGNKKKESEEKTKFIPPTLEEVKKYFAEKGYKDSIAVRAFESYNVAGWVDSKGQKILNWKQKMINVWFRDEHKITKSEMVY
jgi:hypothetical protein